MGRKRKKPVKYGVIKQNYIFVLDTKAHKVVVGNMTSEVMVEFVVSDALITRLDLHIWADGFMASRTERAVSV